MTNRVESGRRPGADNGRDLELIVAAAEEGGRIAMRYFTGAHALDVQMKNGTSPVSAADLAVDRHLHDTLTAARPGYGWLSEETADADDAARHSARRTFIVDPIDGTRAFVDGRKEWCVSVAVVEAGRPVAGVLVCPALGLTYSAAHGRGAFRNGAPIRSRPAGPVPVVAASRDVFELLRQRFDGELKRHDHVPSLAYRLALIADGRLDATVVKPRAHDWDIAAAMLILEEAGGRLTTLDGGAVRLNAKDIAKPALIAGRESLVDRMFGVVTEDAFS